jgi:hypothetical protein
LKVYPAGESAPKPKAPAPQEAPKPKRRSPATKAEVGKRGIVVEEALKTGAKRWSELKKAIAHAGLSESTLNSLISKWQSEGKIERGPNGLWQLVEQKGHSHVEAHA